MVVIEFRIPLPLEASEFHRGQLYMVAKASAEATSGDEGIEWLRNEPYDNTDGHWGVSPLTGVLAPRSKGQYTLKKYHLKSHIPSVVAALLPANAMFLLEEAWNGYPHCKTVLVNGYMDVSKFRIDVETMHVDNDLTLENAVGLSPEELKSRKVEWLEIATAFADPKGKHYKPQYDASKFKSVKTGRGPLAPGWAKSGARPLMCCYKVVRVDFKYWGLQSTVEGTITSSQRDLFARTLCQAFTMIDEWVDLPMSQVRALEEEVARKSAASLVVAMKASADPSLKEVDYAKRREPAGATESGAAAAASSASGAPAEAAASS